MGNDGGSKVDVLGNFANPDAPSLTKNPTGVKIYQEMVGETAETITIAGVDVFVAASVTVEVAKRQRKCRDCMDSAAKICPCKDLSEGKVFASVAEAVQHAGIWHSRMSITKMIGFYPVVALNAHQVDFKNGLSPSVPGHSIEEPIGNAKMAFSFRMCPQTEAALIRGMRANSRNKFNLFNIGAPNCIGWICRRLADANIPCPAPTYKPRLRPEDILP